MTIQTLRLPKHPIDREVTLKNITKTLRLDSMGKWHPALSTEQRAALRHTLIQAEATYEMDSEHEEGIKNEMARLGLLESPRHRRRLDATHRRAHPRRRHCVDPTPKRASMKTYRIRTREGVFPTKGHDRADAIKRFQALYDLPIMTIIEE